MAKCLLCEWYFQCLDLCCTLRGFTFISCSVECRCYWAQLLECVFMLVIEKKLNRDPNFGKPCCLGLGSNLKISSLWIRKGKSDWTQKWTWIRTLFYCSLQVMEQDYVKKANLFFAVLLHNGGSWNTCDRKRNLLISAYVLYNDLGSQRLFDKRSNWTALFLSFSA